MTDIVSKLRQSYHLDTVQPEHPIRRAVDEIERLRAECAEALALLREARDTIDTLPGYPKGADLCDRIDALLAKVQP